MLSCGQRDSSDKSRRSGHQNASSTNALHCVSKCSPVNSTKMRQQQMHCTVLQYSPWRAWKTKMRQQHTYSAARSQYWVQYSMWLEKLKSYSAPGTPFQGAVKSMIMLQCTVEKPAKKASAKMLFVKLITVSVVHWKNFSCLPQQGFNQLFLWLTPLRHQFDQKLDCSGTQFPLFFYTEWIYEEHPSGVKVSVVHKVGRWWGCILVHTSVVHTRVGGVGGDAGSGS